MRNTSTSFAGSGHNTVVGTSYRPKSFGLQMMRRLGEQGDCSRQKRAAGREACGAEVF